MAPLPPAVPSTTDRSCSCRPQTPSGQESPPVHTWMTPRVFPERERRGFPRSFLWQSPARSAVHGPRPGPLDAQAQRPHASGQPCSPAPQSFAVAVFLPGVCHREFQTSCHSTKSRDSEDRLLVSGTTKPQHPRKTHGPAPRLPALAPPTRAGARLRGSGRHSPGRERTHCARRLGPAWGGGAHARLIFKTLHQFKQTLHS